MRSWLGAHLLELFPANWHRDKRRHELRFVTTPSLIHHLMTTLSGARTDDDDRSRNIIRRLSLRHEAEL